MVERYLSRLQKPSDFLRPVRYDSFSMVKMYRDQAMFVKEKRSLGQGCVVIEAFLTKYKDISQRFGCGIAQTGVREVSFPES